MHVDTVLRINTVELLTDIDHENCLLCKMTLSFKNYKDSLYKGYLECFVIRVFNPRGIGGGGGVGVGEWRF